jgi:ribonuclease J
MSRKKSNLKKPIRAKAAPSARQETLELIALGGVNEIGKNMFALETADEILLIDCGLSFPGEEHLGVDYLIPDFTYAVNKKKKIVGMLLTHGHEDHIGGLPFFPEEIEIPVYGTPLTVAFAEGKMSETGRQNETEFREFQAGDAFDVGKDFAVESFNVNHSMPDGVGYAIRTPAGLYVHSGDFKIDQTPVDNRATDFAKLSALGEEGVDFLTVDVTNVDKPGYTPSERSVGRGFRQILDRHPGKRVFVAMFASNVHRIQQAIEAAAHYGRVTAPLGRSMVSSQHIALELGYLKVPPDSLIAPDCIGQYSDGELMILATGTQGEPMSALRRMSQDAHKVSIREGDVVVISSRPIPGNEAAVWRTINDLSKLGAKVIYQPSDVHVSGHASREEIKLVCNLLKPKWVMPFHGEPRHVAGFKELASEIRMPEGSIITPELGRRINISRDGVVYGGKAPCGTMLVDGLFVEREGTELLGQRQKLSKGGVLVVTLIVDEKNRKVKSVNLSSSGFVSALNEEIFLRAGQILSDSLAATKEVDFVDYSTYRAKAEEKMERFIWRNTNRKPSILVNVIEA